MSFDYSGKLKLEEVKSRAEELARKLEYEYSDINNLCEALYCKKIPETEDKYTNSAIALLGDNVLKLSLSHKFYKQKQDKQYIDEQKKKYENNEQLKEVCDKLNIYRYAFNNEDFYSDDLPDHKKLPHSGHDIYVEAVVGAIYLDKGFNYVNEWIKARLIPLIEECLI